MPFERKCNFRGFLFLSPSNRDCCGNYREAEFHKAHSEEKKMHHPRNELKQKGDIPFLNIQYMK